MQLEPNEPEHGTTGRDIIILSLVLAAFVCACMTLDRLP